MNKTYDQAMKELEAIVKDLEQGELVSMETYIQKAKQAKELIDYCRQQLSGLETELNKIMTD